MRRRAKAHNSDCKAFRAILQFVYSFEP